jgi:hypothetical protein
MSSVLLITGNSGTSNTNQDVRLEITDKIKGKVTRTQQGCPRPKTLTRTARPVGQREPNILVFEQQ